MPSRRLILPTLALSCALLNIYVGLSGSPWFGPQDSSAGAHGDSPAITQSVTDHLDQESRSRDLRSTAERQDVYNRKDKEDSQSKNHPAPLEPVGSLNGYDLFLVDESSPKTKVHCVGDTHQEETSWLYRSCEYERFCFDLDRLDFVIYQDDILASPLPSGWYSSILREDDHPVTGMEVNAKARNTVQHADPLDYQPHGLFYPRVVRQDPPTSYFLLNVTLIPFFRYHIGYRNPGHHLWQDLVSLYSLIEMFGKEESDIFLVPLKQHIPKGYFREGKADMMNKWGSKLMGMPNFDKYNPFWEDGEFEFRWKDDDGGQSVAANNKFLSPRIICANSGLTGVAQFSQHETHHHNGTHFRVRNKTIDREIVPFWSGRGGFFRRFRHFMMRKLGVQDDSKEEMASRPYFTLLFSQNSSGRGNRASNNFELQMDYLQSVLSPSSTQVRIQNVTLSKMSLKEQVKKMSQTNILFSATGGGTASAIFLPPGAHLVLFYEKWFLDWDYWENIPDLHVHWIPIEHLQDPSHLPALQFLIEQCLVLAKIPPGRWNTTSTTTTTSSAILDKSRMNKQ